ncbi:MFS transporter [Seonamhaeicola aphaedonensis]|uniref:ACS family hexuronate transporter-like MFS transporter n=1 Tax=Seonamhaeicola aphaedonensis TaxID=1461338 RepID=A0A3D9H8C2_9FLAO|nr:MFS transporter [Seonamhaeicola aphaedonensis]RED45729.1 ACS family hexuronate transporter-like MFS transporter [Seonamhaeicola aphaedonensis]
MSETKKIGNYRYRILALLMFATTINYFDRSIIGVMAPTLEKMFGWTNTDYANIMISFKVAYAIGMLSMGGLIDKLGTKKGYILSIGLWSVFGMLHAAVRPAFSVIGFAAARFGLGFGESGNFPAAIKTTAEWFPKKDRAFATGLFNAATSIGAIAAPFVVGWIVHENGKNWQIPFLITGALSALWVFLWLRTYKKPEVHPDVSKEELTYIQSDSGKAESEEKLPWKSVLGKRQTWAFALAKVTDAVWWFYLFWGAKFLAETFDVNIKNIALPFFVIYILADGGSILGGYLSGVFIRKGWSVNKARKITLLICGLIILPVAYVAITDSKWLAICLIGLGAAGHQAWSANIFTLASDVFPKKATASVVGIGGMVGAVAGILADYLLGSVLDQAGNTGYFWAFLVAGSCYLIILGLVHLLMPKMTPLDENLNLIEE